MMILGILGSDNDVVRVNSSAGPISLLPSLRVRFRSTDATAVYHGGD